MNYPAYSGGVMWLLLLLGTSLGVFAGTDPRAKPEEYSHWQSAGAQVALGADLHGRGIPGADGGLMLKNYVVVEVGLFPRGGARLATTAGKFWLKIDGRPPLLASTPGEVGMQLRLGDFEGPQQSATVQAGPAVIAIDRPRQQERFPGDPMPGGRQRVPAPPAQPGAPTSGPEPPWEFVKRVALEDGEGLSPRAGMLYFRWREKLTKAKSLALIFDGPDGRVVLPLK